MMSFICVVLFLQSFATITTAKVNISNLFPFGIQYGDTVLAGSDNGFATVQLKHPFRYFGQTYSKLFVSVNGVISFISGISTLPSCIPLSYPGIAAFYADASSVNSGIISYRESTATGDQLKAKRELLTVFSTYSKLKVDSVFIVTWNKVPFRVAKNCSGSSRLTNTFQTILIKAGRMSFVVFYYKDIEWTAGSGANCDGTGSNWAQAGFDSGYGSFYALNSSCSANVRNLQSTSNVNSEGMWVYQVDTLHQDTRCRLVCPAIGYIF